jgi:hypothetical protein
MKLKITMHYFKNLYIFFTILALTISFFSTVKVDAKAFKINNIEISKPFENNFNKKDIVNIGFKEAFFDLMTSLLKSSDLQKINQTKLNEIKGMIESFSIKEERFIDQTYYVNLGVSFNKKKIFNYLESKNVFPSIPTKENFLFVPIIIDEKIDNLIIFSNNQILDNWNKTEKKTHLIKYILPSEDLEDYNMIKARYGFLENYNFKEITDKYFLKNSIVSLVFKNEKGIRVLSRVTIKDKIFITNKLYLNLDLNNENQLSKFIDELKKNYEDIWKENNQINTSIKLPLIIRANSFDQEKLNKFEVILEEMDLVYDFSIQKFNKDHIFYEIIFNGTSVNFIDAMNSQEYDLDTQRKIWILK